MASLPTVLTSGARKESTASEPASMAATHHIEKKHDRKNIILPFLPPPPRPPLPPSPRPFPLFLPFPEPGIWCISTRSKCTSARQGARKRVHPPRHNAGKGPRQERVMLDIRLPRLPRNGADRALWRLPQPLPAVARESLPQGAGTPELPDAGTMAGEYAQCGSRG